jgi:hypothetical protein
MKSPIALLLTLGLGTFLGFGVTMSLGVRDAIYNSASLTDPVYVAIKRNISTSYKELGNAWLPFDANAARDAYGEALRIDWFVKTSLPQNPESNAHLAYSYSKLGEAALALDDYAEAADRFRNSVDLLEALDLDANKAAEQGQSWTLILPPTLTPQGMNNGHDVIKNWLAIQRRNLTICREAQRAGTQQVVRARTR